MSRKTLISLIAAGFVGIRLLSGYVAETQENLETRCMKALTIESAMERNAGVLLSWSPGGTDQNPRG